MYVATLVVSSAGDTMCIKERKSNPVQNMQDYSYGPWYYIRCEWCKRVYTTWLAFETSSGSMILVIIWVDQKFCKVVVSNISWKDGVVIYLNKCGHFTAPAFSLYVKRTGVLYGHACFLIQGGTNLALEKKAGESLESCRHPCSWRIFLLPQVPRKAWTLVLLCGLDYGEEERCGI